MKAVKIQNRGETKKVRASESENHSAGEGENGFVEGHERVPYRG